MKSIEQLVKAQFIQHCNIFAVRRKKVVKTEQASKQDLLGVLFTKTNINRGQKPSVRTDFGMGSVGVDFFISCGQSTKTCNDIRSFQLVQGEYAEWRVRKTDAESYDLQERIGHSFEVFNNFFVFFAGAGAYRKEIYKRFSFDDVVIYNSQTDQYTALKSGYVELDQLLADETKVKFIGTASS